MLRHMASRVRPFAEPLPGARRRFAGRAQQWRSIRSRRSPMRFTKSIAPLTIAAALTVAAPAVAAPTGASALRQFEGTVVSVDKAGNSFRLRDAERGTVRIRVTSSTRFQRVAGLAGLEAGMKRIEAKVRRSGGDWVASKVERSRNGARHGADDHGRGRGNDDAPGRHGANDDRHGDDD